MILYQGLYEQYKTLVLALKPLLFIQSLVSILTSLVWRLTLITHVTGQVSLQARIGEELDTVKDQVDILRENSHHWSRYGTEVGDIRSRLVMLETQGHSESIYLSNMSQTNNQLDETTVLPSQVSLDVSIGCAESFENIIDMSQPRVEQEILAATANDDHEQHAANHETIEASHDQDQDTLAATNDHEPLSSIKADDHDAEVTEEISAATDTEPTHPLTARTLDHDEDHAEWSVDDKDGGHLRDVDEWNFSSVATIDDHSITAEERQQIIVDNLYRRKPKDKTKKKIKNMNNSINQDEEKPTDCFNSLFLQFFVKVFD